MHALTMIELLIAIAVIAILAALSLPALSSMVERADRGACLNNMRQVLVAAAAVPRRSQSRHSSWEAG
jgi:general secretion pathway protein G